VYNEVDYCESSSRNIKAHDYLLRHSERNLDQFCLSYIFTKNNFDDGNLGLAFTASSVRGQSNTFLKNKLFD
jgi:hypothetical protein